MWGGFYSLFIVYSIYYMFMGMLEAMDSALIFPFPFPFLSTSYSFLLCPFVLGVLASLYMFPIRYIHIRATPIFFLFVLTVITLVCYLFFGSFSSLFFPLFL